MTTTPTLSRAAQDLLTALDQCASRYYPFPNPLVRIERLLVATGYSIAVLRCLIQELRRAGIITLTGAEGPTTPADRGIGLYEHGVLQIYASRRDPE